MKKLNFVAIVIITLLSTSFAQQKPLEIEGEKHLKNVKQLSFGGENAEAYFSADSKQLIFQSKRDGRRCDQIYRMNIDGSQVKMVSNGDGRTTCSYFFKNGKRVLYASTHGGKKECPPDPDFSQGYVWAVYSDYDIYTATPDGKDIKRLTSSPGYDAEATISPDGKKIVFTSERSGDLELYSMNVDGTNIKRLTDAVGYDGGAFYSPDNKKATKTSPNPIPTTTEIKDGNYEGEGTIIKINNEIGSVELDHREIVGLMPAMRMEFSVSDRSLLRGLAAGDAARFTIFYKGGTEIITRIVKKNDAP